MERTLLKIDPGIRWHICDIESHVVWNHCFYNKGNKTRKGETQEKKGAKEMLWTLKASRGMLIMMLSVKCI